MIPPYVTISSEKCSLRALFKSPGKVAKNQWTLVGNPPLIPGGGISLDGATQYCHRPIIHEFNSPGITIAVWFTPDFNWDEDVDRIIFDTTNGSRYFIFKFANAGNHKLRIYLGNTLIADVPSATYSPYWKQGERNLLVASGKSGDNNAWLNGAQILTGNATAWAPTPPAVLYAGAQFDGARKFDGIIHEVHVFEENWDCVQEAAFRNNSTFAALGQADCLLPMRVQEGTGVVGDEYRTPDRSGKGRDVFLGDGVTPATLPTFQNPGFHFDGTGEYLEIPNASGIYNNAEQTTIAAFVPFFSPGDGQHHYFWDGGGSGYILTKRNTGIWSLYMAATLVADIPMATYQPYWWLRGMNVLVVSGKSGNTNVWLNAHKILDADNTAWTPADAPKIQLGIPASYGAGFDFVGIWQYFSAYSFLFSPTMVREITHRLLTGGY